MQASGAQDEVGWTGARFVPLRLGVRVVRVGTQAFCSLDSEIGRVIAPDFLHLSNTHVSFFGHSMCGRVTIRFELILPTLPNPPIIPILARQEAPLTV